MNDDHLPKSEAGGKVPHDADREDGVLRERFALLRREEKQQAPEFASLWRGRVRVPRDKRRWLVAAVCALIVVVAVIWLRSTQHKRVDVSLASIMEWKSPTDFLLETPGRELLRTVPRLGEPKIGGWSGHTEPPRPGASPSPVTKKVLH